MEKTLRAYRFINVLSLDVTAGSMICAAFFSHVLGVKMVSRDLITLGLTVWIIYTIDHLLDARKIHTVASTRRHRFHQRHFKTLIILVTAVIFLDAIAVFYMSGRVVMGGVLLSSIVIIYFFIQRQLGFLKEFFGALLYTSGILLVPFLLKSKELSIAESIVIIQFVIIVLINLLLFSWFDRLRDERDKQPSFTTIFGDRIVRMVLSILFGISVIVVFIQLYYHVAFAALFVLILMNITLLTIFLNKKYFEVEDRYRLLGDAVFLLPIIYGLI